MNESSFSGGKPVTFSSNGTYSSGPNPNLNNGNNNNHKPSNNKKGLFKSATVAEKKQLKRMAIVSAIICVVIAVIVFLGIFAFKAVTGKGLTTTTLGSSGSSVITQSDDSDTLAEAVASKCLPSVCSVDVYGTSSSSSSLGSNSGTLSQTATGSGVVISKEGHIVTNQHVIDGGKAYKVNLGGTSYDADLVGQDSSSDIAVLKVKGVDNLTPIELGDSDNIKVGEWVMSIGSPFGLEQSVATGIVSATSRSQVVSSSSGSSSSSSGAKVYPNLIQTDAAINPGNSGGALVDKNGKLIGINALIQSSSGNYSGVGFAIPVNYAISLSRQIIEGKTPSHAQLGVTMTSVTASAAQQYGWNVSEGAYVTGVTSGGPASNAGLKVGDIITKIDDTSISSSSDLLLAVRSHNPGDKVNVTYVRDNNTESCTVTLGSDEGQSSSSQNNNSNSNSNSNSNGSNGYDLNDLYKYFFGQ